MEGASSWLAIFAELKARGMEDCFIACVDGLRGLPEAIETLFPHARVQLCIVHQVRKSLRYVPWKERKAVAASLRAVYAAPGEEAALSALGAFEQKWSEKYPVIAPLWRKDWERLAPFFDYAPAIRKVVYTTNAVESLNYSLRKIVKGGEPSPTTKRSASCSTWDCERLRRSGSDPYATGRPRSTSSSYFTGPGPY